MGSTYAVKRPVAWIGAIVLLALIVLAIVLPITARRKEDVYVSRFEGHYPRFEPFSTDNDPFATLTPEQRQRAQTAFNTMSGEQKRGYANVYPTYGGVQTGPPVPGFEDYETLVKTGKVGAFLNFNVSSEIRQIQAWATGTGNDNEGINNSGTPLLLGYDVIHGYATIFPVNLGMASAWDPEMVYDHAAWAAKESRTVGIKWNFNPMLDVARDGRWGRISEGSGEDAYLVGTLGYAYIQGYQDNGMAACVKHVGAYGVTRAGRDYSSGEMGRLALFNEYFESYRRAFKAKPWTAMASFNTVFRNPAHGNRELLQDILRGQWGFDGFVVADWSGGSDMFAQRTIEKTAEASGKRMIVSGVDMNMSDDSYWVGLDTPTNTTRTESGRTYVDHIDLAVKRILAVKERMNLAETWHPVEDDLPLRGAMEAAQIAAEKSAVLLKNGDVIVDFDENDKPITEKVLPLSKDVEKEIWLVGKIAENPRDHQGSWSTSGVRWTDDVVTVRQELENRRGTSEEGNWKYFQGYQTTWRYDPAIHSADDLKAEWDTVNEVVEAFDTANPKPDSVVFVVGENCNQNGEGTSRTNLTMSGVQLDMVQRIYEINVALPVEERSKLIYVVMAGRPLTIPWEAEHLDAILYAWNNGSRGGPAIWNLLFGDRTPGGKLPITMARNVGQLPINYQYRGSRAQLNREQMDHILDPRYCLWGADRPDHDQHHRHHWGGRCYMATYIDSPISPLYWFGHGLSYSEFEYANVALNSTQMSNTAIYNDRPKLEVSFEVRRTGGRRDLDAVEIVQVYVRDVRASVMPTVKNLRGYTRVTFPANPDWEEGDDVESQTVSIVMDVYEDFGFWNEAMEWVVEPGRFDIMVAKSSDDEEHLLPFYVIDTTGRANLPLGARAD